MPEPDGTQLLSDRQTRGPRLSPGQSELVVVTGRLLGKRQAGSRAGGAATSSASGSCEHLLRVSDCAAEEEASVAWSLGG
jgi:hypothetical protein